MDIAQRRVLGLVAVASWILIDAIRAAGPLLSSLADSGAAFAVGAALLTFASGGVLAWIAALAGRHFGHGVVVLFLLGVVALARLGLPLLGGAWLVSAALYLTALSLAVVVLAARVAMGNGGSPTLLAGTALGAAAAVAEQTVLRTWDAVWRGDLLGWVAIAGVALLALASGWRTMRLEPSASSRGWWAYGLLWSLMVLAFANVSWLNAQTGLRMSATALLAIASLSTAALLAGQATVTSRVTVTVLGAVGLGALSVLMLRPGLAAAIALPVAVSVLSLAAASVMRSTPSAPGRRLGAATVLGLAVVVPMLLVQLDAQVTLPGTAAVVMVVAGAAVIVGAVWRAWTAAPRPEASSAGADVGDGATRATPDRARAPWIAPGVLLRATLGFVVAGALAAWTFTTYETPRALSENFLPAPTAMTWSVNHGVQPEVTGGPDVRLDEVAATIRGSAADVVMLQEVSRGWLAGGGADVLEYLAGELQLPYAYAGADGPQFGNAILTSREHANPRSITLPAGDGPHARSAVAVDFMGATFASTRLDPRQIGGGEAQAEALIDWLDVPQPLVIGGDLGDVPSSAVLAVLSDAGFASAQDVAGTSGVTYLGTDPAGGEALTLDYLMGRGVEFRDIETLGVPWSDHLPLLARVATGATAPTEAGEDLNEIQPEAGTSPSPSTSATASPSTDSE
ncbi:endonuclease/exonuclease/phosphatase family protein [Demequina activiva]|nr:endonuclease/exonuclease/phosphatase family protein [Demequina activiva]